MARQIQPSDPLNAAILHYLADRAPLPVTVVTMAQDLEQGHAVTGFRQRVYRLIRTGWVRPYVDSHPFAVALGEAGAAIVASGCAPIPPRARPPAVRRPRPIPAIAAAIYRAIRRHGESDAEAIIAEVCAEIGSTPGRVGPALGSLVRMGYVARDGGRLRVGAVSPLLDDDAPRQWGGLVDEDRRVLELVERGIGSPAEIRDALRLTGQQVGARLARCHRAGAIRRDGDRWVVA